MTRDVSRRGLLGAMATGATVVTAGATGAVAGNAIPIRGSWNQHGATAANTSRSGDRGPRYDQRLRWHRRLPSADSAPLVVDDTALVLRVGDSGRNTSGGGNDASSDRPADDGTYVQALYASTGRERWRASLSGSVVSGVLAADDERVFSAEVTQPRVTAHSLADGEQEWERLIDSGGASDTTLAVGGGFRGAPRVRGDRLYLKSRSAGSAAASVVALDAATGRVETVFPGVFTHFAVGAGRLVGVSGSPFLEEYGLTLFDPESDDPQGRTYGTAGRPGRPTVGGDLVFIGTSENRLHAVDGDAEAVWTAGTGGWAVSLALVAGVVLAATDERLLAFDADTGRRLWSTAAGSARPVAANGVVYVDRPSGFDGYDVATGEAVVTYRNRWLPGTASHLSIAGNALLGTTARGRVFAVQEKITLPV